MTVGAFLFDLDGTLIDSMPLHHEAWRRWYAERDLRFDEGGFFEATAGRTNAEILADLFPQCSVAEHDAMAQRKEAIYRDLAERSLQPIAGFAAFHRAAREAGLALGICTAAPPDNMALAFRRFGLDKLVDVITSPADRATGPSPATGPSAVDGPARGLSPADGLRGKPHPDIFVEAARRLGVAPPQCIVFEDAPLGIEAARRAGMRAVALTTSLPATAFALFPNLVATAPDFTTLRVASLTEHNQVIHHA
jgi:beta-phosphoglucomutase-like phosphatase (HAD superfamily)